MKQLVSEIVEVEKEISLATCVQEVVGKRDVYLVPGQPHLLAHFQSESALFPNEGEWKDFWFKFTKNGFFISNEEFDSRFKANFFGEGIFIPESEYLNKFISPISIEKWLRLYKGSFSLAYSYKPIFGYTGDKKQANDLTAIKVYVAAFRLRVPSYTEVKISQEKNYD